MDHIASKWKDFTVLPGFMCTQHSHVLEFNLEGIFHEIAEVEKAVGNLNGRWFGGRTIKAEVYDEEKFESGDLTA